MKVKHITKIFIDTIHNITNTYIEKGLEVNNFELRIEDLFTCFQTPFNYGHNQDDETVIDIQTSHCGCCDNLYIESFRYKVNGKKGPDIIELVDRINSVVNGEKFQYHRRQGTVYLNYISKIRDFSKNVNLLDDVLSNHLNNIRKFYPLIERQLTTDESPSSIWEDFEKSSSDEKIMVNVG